MKLVIGLGNPGTKYKNNRHNVGFIVLDMLAIAQGFSWRYSQDMSCYFVKSTDYVLAKPTTFMNESGIAAKSLCDYFKIKAEDILVVHDELDLPLGKIRLSFNGVSAGHKGVESINECVSTQDFARLRIGIGHPRSLKNPKAVNSYVLEDFSKEEVAKLPEVIDMCEQAILSYIDEGVSATMNLFN